jgi:hypothetical protein
MSLARLRHGTTTAIGVLLDVSTWASGRSGSSRSPRRADSVQLDNSALLMRRSGWRVLTATAGESLPTLWPQVAYVGLDGDFGARQRAAKEAAATAAATAGSRTQWSNA